MFVSAIAYTVLEVTKRNRKMELIQKIMISLHQFSITFSAPIKATMNRADVFIMHAAIDSWIKTTKNAYILLFYDYANYTDSTCKWLKNELTSKYRRRVKVKKFNNYKICGTKPIVSNWINLTLKYANTDYVTLINSDIIVSPNFYYVMCKYVNLFRIPQLYVSNRINVIFPNLSITLQKYEKNVRQFKMDVIRRKISNIKYSKMDHGIDMFTWKRGTLIPKKVLDFCIGCPFWDNYMAQLGLEGGIVICTYNAIPIYHIQLMSHTKWQTDRTCYPNRKKARTMPNYSLNGILCATLSNYVIPKKVFNNSLEMKKSINLSKLQNAVCLKPIIETFAKQNLTILT